MKKDSIEGLKIVALSLLIVLLVIGILGIYLATITYKTIMDPLFVKNIMDKEDVYYQIRQTMFRMINNNLPNGKDSIPYLEDTVTETWLKEEIETLILDFYSFAKGNRSSPPTIPIGKLKDKVVQDMGGDRPLKEKIKLVQFWFEPLPDEVRLEDFMSIDTIWTIRYLVRIVGLFIYIMICISILAMVSIRLTVGDWEASYLWLGSGLIASGILLFLLIFFGAWILRHMTLVENFSYTLQNMGIPKTNGSRILLSFIHDFIKPIKWIAPFSSIIGGIIIYIIPTEDNIPTLI